MGFLAGAAGAAVIGAVAWATGAPVGERGVMGYVWLVSVLGVAGSGLDSVLGELFQETVVDVRTGKVVEAPGGGRVLVLPGERSVGMAKEERVKLGSGERDAEVLERHKVEDRETMDSGEVRGPSRKVSTGNRGVLTNNGVNLVMASMVTWGGLWLWAGSYKVLLEALLDAARAVVDVVERLM